MSRPRANPDEIAKGAFILDVKISRLRYNMKQSDLADRVGVCPSVMSQLLNNPDKISVGRLRRIIQALDLDPQIILALVGYSQKEIKDFQRGSQ